MERVDEEKDEEKDEETSFVLEGTETVEVAGAMLDALSFLSLWRESAIFCVDSATAAGSE